MLHTRFVDSLHDPPSGNRAIGTHVIRFDFPHLPEHRSADLHRIGEKLALDSVRAVVAGAAFDGTYAGFRNPFQNLARLLADVLHTRVAGICLHLHTFCYRTIANRGGLYGVGLNYDITRSLATRVEWTRYTKLGDVSTTKGDVDLYSVGLNVKF